MPRDLSGNYTLPAGNPVVTGTTIAATWANPTLSDIAYQLNQVVTRDGLLAATGPIRFVAGLIGAPGISFTASPSTGLFSPATDQVAISANAGLTRIALSPEITYFTSNVMRGRWLDTGGLVINAPSSAGAALQMSTTGVGFAVQISGAIGNTLRTIVSSVAADNANRTTLANNAVVLELGTEGTAGGQILSGASPSVAVFGTSTAHAVEFAAQGVVRLAIKTTGQVRFIPRTTPGSPLAGDVYYDSGTNKLRCYNGTIWNDLF